LMSMRAMLRWAVAATCSGFSITWIVRWFFPLAEPAYFGAIIQVAQATVVTVYLALSTNTWSRLIYDEEASKDGADVPKFTRMRRSLSQHFQTQMRQQIFDKASVFSGVCGATFSALLLTAILKGYASDPTMLLGCLIALCVFGYPTLQLLQFMVHDLSAFFRNLAKTEFSLEKLVSFFVTWSHTPGGRFLPLVFFGTAISIVSGVSMVGLLLTSFCVAIVSVIIYVVAISRMGFLRALFEGRSQAVGLIALIVGVWVGRSTMEK